jgi:hypothetical protein
MKSTVLLCFLILFASVIYSQKADSINNSYLNITDKLMIKDGNLTIGGYGEIIYNQKLNSSFKSNGELNVERLVLLFGYKFNDRTQFIIEIEFEDVKEVWVEQAFLQYKINKFINFRGGLLLIPMGIINEYHEPTTFNGVNRPLLDKTISPTTWREVGFGLNGNILPAYLKYQLYLVNGFNGYGDDGKTLNGASGLRNGRQKGAESFISAPNFTGKLEYYGIKGLNIGLSGYFGNTQSTLYNKMDKSDMSAAALADSSVVGISMFGLDSRYTSKGLQMRAQVYYVGISNTQQYNSLSLAGSGNDLGSKMIGYYFEVAYNVLRSFNDIKSELLPFIRYEAFNTHSQTEGTLVKNPAYNKSVITTGFGWKITKGAIIKTDFQFFKNQMDSKYSTFFNVGIGVTF